MPQEQELSIGVRDLFATQYPIYKPEEAEERVVKDTFFKFRETADSRDKSFNFFDGQTLIQMIEKNVEAFYTNIFETDYQEDWEAKVHNPFTRNKIIAALSKVVQALPVIEYFGRGDEDMRRGQLLTDISKYTDDLDDYEELIVYALLEALVKGTAIGFEGFEEKKKLRRSVTEKFGEPISITEKTEIVRRFYSSIVPLEDFYPSSVGIKKIKNMPYCFWRTTLSYSQFMLKWGYLPRANHVLPKYQVEGDTQKPFYLDYVSDDVAVGEVEVLRYYNQDIDEYILIANGIWLNPMPEWTVEPLPWESKTLPFWSFIYEPYGTNFFFGKGLADKMSGLQFTLDLLGNMLTSQSFLSIWAPTLIAGGIDTIEDDFLRPGRRIPIDTGGLPIRDVFQKLDVGTPGGWHQFILEYTKKIMEETSMDPTSQGVAGGERVTATAVRKAAASVVQMIGLFTRFTKSGLKDRARLKGSLILQYIDKPLLEQVLGEGGTLEFNKAFNVFKLEDTVLSSGKRGMKIIEVFKEAQQLPTKKALKLQARILEKETGKRVEKVAMLPEYVRNWEFDIRLVMNMQSEENRDSERVFEIEFQTVMNQLYPDLIDREELAGELIEKFGKRPEKILQKGIFQVLPPVAKGTPQSGATAALPANIIKGEAAV